MPLNKINLSSNTKVEFDDVQLNGLLNLLDVKQKINTSKITVNTTSSINIHLTKLSELKILLEEKVFSREFGNLIIDSNSTFSSSIENINSIFDELISNNKVDYIKQVELVSVDKDEITFKIHSKIGIAIPLVIELPITLERFLIVNFKVKNGIKIFLRIINSILKFSSDKTIIDKNDNFRIDLREIIKIPKPILYVIDNWTSNLKGYVFNDSEFIKLNLAFKVDKTPFDELKMAHN
jgi:hypothetical protein